MWQPIVNPISYKRNHSTMKTNNINLFCDIVTQRSGEHSCAINILLQQQLYGQVISILRQELDSMVRVMFLLSISDLNLREHFINQTLEGIKWSYPNTKKVVTDKQMVDLADKFYGWPFFVYKLGCAFIHLSAMVYYKNSNPFLLLSVSERNDITRFLHQYHSFPLELELNLENIIPYLDKVFSRPLKSPFLRDIVQVQYLAYFLKHAQKSFHSSFEVICCCREKYVHSISYHTLIKVAAQTIIRL